MRVLEWGIKWETAVWARYINIVAIDRRTRTG